MDEIISYKMCAVKVRNAKLRNYHFYICNIFHCRIPMCALKMHIYNLYSVEIVVKPYKVYKHCMPCMIFYSYFM